MRTDKRIDFVGGIRGAGGTGAARRLGPVRRGVLAVSGDHRRSDAHRGCRRHHAAEVDLVRAEAARRAAVAPAYDKYSIADKFEQSGIDGLKACGCEVVYEPDLKDDALARAIATSGAQVLVVRSTQVTEPMLDAGELSLIVRAGAGVNTIDVAAASRRGIYVSNCPGKNAIAVAELAFALMLALDRRIPDNVTELAAASGTRRSSRRRRVCTAGRSA